MRIPNDSDKIFDKILVDKSCHLSSNYCYKQRYFVIYCYIVIHNVGSNQCPPTPPNKKIP